MDKKRQIFEFIRERIESVGLPPTIREIGMRFGISSTNGVRYFLRKLEDEGLIERERFKARGIRLKEKFPSEKVRVVPILGRIPAGEPIISDENIEGNIVVDERLAKGKYVFALRVKGNSMINAGINDGDIAVVKKDPYPSEGEIVVAMVDGEVTLKRFVRNHGKPILKPENPDYSPIDLSSYSSDQVRIIGKVIAIIRRFY